MAEVPLPPVETVDDAMRRASQGIDALKRAKPATPAEARRRAAELMRHQQDLIDAAQRVTNAAATKQFAKPNGAARAAANTGMDAEAFDRAIWPYLEAVAKGVMPLIKEIEQRLDALEARPEAKASTIDGAARQQLFDGGTWKSERVFQPGDVVTYIGTLWVCREQNVDTRPGKSDAWRLMEKSHR